ncbi:MAG: outer membrane protein assembly factor BamB [Burkholderiaceae bacterium]
MSAARRAGQAALATLALLLAACATADKPKPTALEAYTAQLSARVLWSQRIEGGIGFSLAPAVNGSVVTLASGDGSVFALEADTGRPVWRTSVGAKLVAGVGSDGRVAAVVTEGNELVAIEAGREIWRKPLGTRVSAAPLVAGERVFVLGLDRSVQAYDALNGTRLWSLQRPGEPLALAQAGVIVAFKDTLVAGQGPRLAGIDPTRGQLRWEAVVGSPRGGNEVERLADLSAPAARVGDVVCARAFQAAVGCVDAERGAALWSKNVGGIDGVAADASAVYAADASDRISAWRLASGDVVWTSDKLLYRGLSAPVAVDKAVVFGDVEGTLHWLSKDKGETLARIATDGSPIALPLAKIGNTVLALTRNGGVYAVRAE